MTRLDELLSCIRNPHVYVQMHNYPDQDAIASAIGLKTLLEARGKQATIIYYGEIDRSNTLSMVCMLNIDIKLVSEVHLVPEDEIIIVDGQKGNVNVTDFIGDEIACIDHHKVRTTDIYRFCDIRSDVGACSSMITSYFLENDIPIPNKVATALLYGIKMDCAQMSRGVSELDLDMFCYLYKAIDITILRVLDNSSLQRRDLEAYSEAINNLRIEQHVGLANVGKDCSEATLGSVSDFLLTMEEIKFVLVYSHRNGGVKFSARSETKHLDASDVIRDALNGIGDGGGHADMAAGFVPNIQNEKMALKVISQVEQNVLRIIEHKMMAV